MSAELFREFTSLWESGSRTPDIFTFLDEHSDAESSTLLAILLHDQHQRWRTEHPLTVEEYLARLPRSASNAETKLQLAIGEYHARRHDETLPCIEAFTARFSDVRERLLQELAKFDADHTLRDKTDFTATWTFTSEQPGRDRQIGRYRVIRVLGEGAFGRVYLGFDEELQRHVAIKVPTKEHFLKPRDAEAYLEEARKIASLDHPNILPVYDTGRTGDGSIYIVSKFIEGGTLGERIRRARPSYGESARLLATVARALHHAHERKLIHRDVKPGNLLIEEKSGTPYVADFGLAIREEDYLRSGAVVGTPAYMSPEQARGEGHRLDCRSDIFSLGVIFYKLLTGKRPFRGSTANELFHQVISADPMPPAELDETVPAELERICLRALSKRASDRYANAAEFADDLLYWIRSPQQQPQECQIVPKGLRSFDANDADFFLSLLPGPRDRDGLPESLRFWKTRIEDTDPDKTFSVGLVYGPSGCGKSSLVKAGLLPRLSRDVVVVYVEAIPDETEVHLLRALRKQLPQLPRDLGLVEVFAYLRRTEGHKVLVVLDQFEQWLHSHTFEQETELISALRQCDGGTLQGVVLIRDDFAMAAARFMDSLDIPILQGYNFGTVDLFDIDHAKLVLIKFGQAFGKLPAQTSKMSDQEQAFVAAVASGLAQDGKVVSVRLALFAEMVKGKPWHLSTLEDIGGTSGIGVNFLEETFSSRSANPRHRWHQRAARAVLQALLPEVGNEIRGHMKSHAELLKASGYQDRPKDFAELLRILDGELRLITPTDPEGVRSDSGSDGSPRHYQLTHDYLVASLQNWSTRKQRETAAGRASIRLAERTRMWRIRKEKKQLPSWFEWSTIRALTRPTGWSPPQREMMRVADRLHALRSLSAVLMVLLFTIGTAGVWRAVQRGRDWQRLQSMAALLFDARTEQVGKVLGDLDGFSADRVTEALNAELERRAHRPADELRVDLFRVAHAPAVTERLIERLKNATTEEHDLIVQRLEPWKPLLMRQMDRWFSGESVQPKDKLLLACGFARIAPAAPKWAGYGPSIADALVRQGNPSQVQVWIERLHPIAAHLTPTLEKRFSEPDARETERIIAAAALAQFHRDQPQRMLPLLGRADSTQLAIFADAFLTQPEDARSRLAGDLVDVAASGTLSEKANAGLMLLRMRDPRGWSVFHDDASYQLRSAAINGCGPFGILPGDIVTRLADSDAEGSLQTLLLCLETYSDSSQDLHRAGVIDLLDSLWRHHGSAGVHSSAELVLRRLGQESKLRTAKRQLASPEPAEDADWYINGQGLTMNVISPPQRFTSGSPLTETEREIIEDQKAVDINYRFAVSAHEVTVAQFCEFDPEFKFSPAVVASEDCPINNVTWYDAAKYCRWLSEQEGFPETEMCYPPISEIGPELQMPDDWRRRTGYRLPTEEEWECICRAGTTTSRYYSDSAEPLHKHAWYIRNSNDRLHPVGLLRPNAWGFFDMYGNVLEWCQAPDPENASGNYYFLRSGTYRSIDRENRSAKRFTYRADTSLSFIGLRVARTMPFAGD